MSLYLFYLAESCPKLSCGDFINLAFLPIFVFKASAGEVSTVDCKFSKGQHLVKTLIKLSPDPPVLKENDD